MKVIDAYELDGQLHLMVDGGAGKTYAVTTPATASTAYIRNACEQRVAEEETRERRKVHRKDLLGNL